jgi:hypothetical protein
MVADPVYADIFSPQKKVPDTFSSKLWRATFETVRTWYAGNGVNLILLFTKNYLLKYPIHKLRPALSTHVSSSFSKIEMP